ncbi:extracytoplasmic sigma factor ECF [Luteitalea sp. TBR-22]|uniref:ECF-type sigma factor n=1 Tax=Luteitalea sp. TBR-22 TaxID=2802971 RepID=UPI001AF25DED|nr:ECF-type sigma factor [Luteitalea sp. TBR-22]BCS31713.1 extracytoplasmic sigma factor ECF [Luteitalea sp. TBR-22]
MSGRAPDATPGLDRYWTQVYDRLRDRARRLLARERPGATLQPTALVHDAWLRALRPHRGGWQGPTHVLAVGVQAMRRLLIDRGRHHHRQKRGGDAVAVSLTAVDLAAPAGLPAADRLALARALETLQSLDPRQAEVVRLRAAGFTVPEVARALGVSTRTVEDDWRHGCAWLRRELVSLG